jgi:tetratricopeptide (TPR) repeat protein/tRNA A-37 threonylcarbamoyl transferase component Bud32
VSSVPATAFGEFSVLGVIGEGGTAIVYEARRNGIELALKVLRVENQLTDAECRRFLAEADQLAKVSHPGVIQVFDAGVLPDGRPFLALPLLHGETLAMRLARERLATGAALELFYAAADALAALHAIGLLHRDIKPDNLFLERDRLILLDFGIARDSAASPSTSTQQGLIRGTPAFMAPERFFGGGTAIASEVYELAVTLHMLLAGELPWTDATNLDERLNPRVSPKIAPELATLLRAALSVRLEERPRSVRALADAVRAQIERGAATANQVVAPLAVPVRSRNRYLVPLATATMLVAAAAVAWIVTRPADTAEPPPTATAPHRIVALASPRNSSGAAQDASLAAAIESQLRSTLGGGSLVVAAEPALRSEQLGGDQAATRALSPQVLAAIRTRTNAALVVNGSYIAHPDHAIEVSFVVQDTTSGSVVASTNRSGTTEHLDRVVASAVDELRVALGDRPTASTERVAALVALPTGEEAAIEFAAGTACIRRYALVCARDHYAKAVALAPTSALAHDGLAAALHRLGDDDAATIEARIAVALGHELDPDRQLVLQAHAARYRAAWPDATAAYDKVVAHRPDDLELLGELADVQAHAGHTELAFATLQRARGTSTDPRFDLDEGVIAGKANDFAREEKAADRAIAGADALGERELGAYARLEKGWATIPEDKLDVAKAALEEALQMFSAESDRNGTARAILDLGLLAAQQGDHVAARKRYEDALRLEREIGNRPAIATALLDLGESLSAASDPAGALARYAEALQIARALSDVNLTEETLVDVGASSVKLGDFTAARKAYDEALAIAREHGHQRVICAVLVNTSNLAANAGEDREAVAIGRQGLEAARKSNEPGLVDQALGTLSVHESEAGDFKSALGRLDEIAARERERGDRVGLVNTQVSRVGVLYDADRNAEAVALTTATLATIDAKTDPDNYAWLKLFLARHELDLGHTASAATYLDGASSALVAAQDVELTGEVEIASARVMAARGQLSRAEAQLAKTRADAAAAGQASTLREVDINSAAIEWMYAHDPAARAKLAELARAARAHGADLIAKEAEQAMGTPRRAPPLGR